MLWLGAFGTGVAILLNPLKINLAKTALSNLLTQIRKYHEIYISCKDLKNNLRDISGTYCDLLCHFCLLRDFIFKIASKCVKTVKVVIFLDLIKNPSALKGKSKGRTIFNTSS